jgi:hypothetical protein
MEIISSDEIRIEDQESGEQSPAMRKKPHIIDFMLDNAERRLEVKSPVTARHRLREIVKAQQKIIRQSNTTNRFRLDKLSMSSDTLSSMLMGLREISKANTKKL